MKAYVILIIPLLLLSCFTSKKSLNSEAYRLPYSYNPYTDTFSSLYDSTQACKRLKKAILARKYPFFKPIEESLYIHRSYKIHVFFHPDSSYTLPIGKAKIP